jgi:hypothetical protein
MKRQGFRVGYFDTFLLTGRRVSHVDRNEPMVPEDGFDHHLIGSVSPFPDTRITTLLTPHSPQNPPVSVVVGRIRSHEVASPNALVAPVADVTRPNSVESLRRIRPSATHSSSPTFGFGSSNPSL